MDSWSEQRSPNPIINFANRVADYVETHNAYEAWDKRRCAVEAVRVACEEARDDLMLAIERAMPPAPVGTDPPSTVTHANASYDAERSMEAALKPFGWQCGPEFWQRYYSEAWVFNLANAVERLSAERDRLVALERDGRD